MYKIIKVGQQIMQQRSWMIKCVKFQKFNEKIHENVKDR